MDDHGPLCVGIDPHPNLLEAWGRAVPPAVPVLTGAVSCSVQPQTTQSLVLLPLLASGRPRAAWEAHLRSYREIRRNPKALISLAYHLEYLALVGRVDRGLELLRRHLLERLETSIQFISAGEEGGNLGFLSSPFQQIARQLQRPPEAPDRAGSEEADLAEAEAKWEDAWNLHRTRLEALPAALEGARRAWKVTHKAAGTHS